VVVICSGDDASPPSDAETKPAGLPLALLQHGLAVLRLNRFSTGNPPAFSTAVPTCVWCRNYSVTPV